MYAVFPWETIGHDRDMSIVINEVCNTLRTDYGAGYTATRPRTTKMQKRFDITWKVMDRDKWLALVAFWRLMYGSAVAFYFEYPQEFYGIAGYGGNNDGNEPPDGFDTEYNGMGYGVGPVFLVRFAKDEMPQTVLVNKGMYWEVSTSIQEVI